MYGCEMWSLTSSEEGKRLHYMSQKMEISM